MFEEYHKIKGLFKRSEDGKRELIYGSYRDEVVEYLKDCEWIFTEKIDGMNIRICWDGHNVSYYGRTNKAIIPKQLKEYLDNTFMTEQSEQMFEQLFGEKTVILFGEGYGAGIQKGGDYRNDQSFILFDVKVDDTYLLRESVETISKSFGVDVVPVIMNGTIQSAVNFVMTNPKSKIGTAMMEGVIGKPVVELKNKNW